MARPRETLIAPSVIRPYALRPSPSKDRNVPDDRDIARRALDWQTRARDYALISIPAYREWSKRKLDEGESSALIANLDATRMWLLPEELADVSESLFEEMLADLKEAMGEA
jgi:hypothetical protein